MYNLPPAKPIMCPINLKKNLNTLMDAKIFC